MSKFSHDAAAVDARAMTIPPRLLRKTAELTIHWSFLNRAVSKVKFEQSETKNFFLTIFMQNEQDNTD